MSLPLRTIAICIWSSQSTMLLGSVNIKSYSTLLVWRRETNTIKDTDKVRITHLMIFNLWCSETDLIILLLLHSVLEWIWIRKASRYTASSYTDLAGVCFWIGSKKIWAERIYVVKRNFLLSPKNVHRTVKCFIPEDYRSMKVGPLKVQNYLMGA